MRKDTQPIPSGHFRFRRQIDWNDVKQYLEGYVGDYYEIEESAERIYIGNELPEEYTESESRKNLMGGNAKAKANAATAIPELIQIASNPAFEENRKEKHNKNAKFGWYRYDVRFALPVYDENVLVRYNIFHARLLINHAENGKKYLYDILAVKKKRASRSRMYGENPFLSSCQSPIFFAKSPLAFLMQWGTLFSLDHLCSTTSSALLLMLFNMPANQVSDWLHRNRSDTP